jgi:S-methylmethionine-dependent homocysteine/selenocysteine methylase
MPNGFTPEFLEEVFRIFAAYVSTGGLQDIVDSATYEAIKSAITGKTQEEVLAMARAEGAKLVTRMSKEMQLQLAEKIATGLEQQLGPDGTARLIREGLGLDSNRDAALSKYRNELEAAGKSPDEIAKLVNKRYTELVNDRARTIAVTEMGRSFEAAAIDNHKNQGATHKQSISAACEAEGVIPIDEPFEASGEDTPPFHPNCHCSLGFVYESGDGVSLAVAKEIQDEIIANTEAARSTTTGGE